MALIYDDFEETLSFWIDLAGLLIDSDPLPSLFFFYNARVLTGADMSLWEF